MLSFMAHQERIRREYGGQRGHRGPDGTRPILLSLLPIAGKQAKQDGPHGQHGRSVRRGVGELLDIDQPRGRSTACRKEASTT